WNDTNSDYQDSLCFHQLFEQQVVRTPDAIAVVFEDRKLTYRELNEQANKLAHGLQKRGIQPDSLVAIYLEHSPELIVGLLAILKAGGAYLPLDPVYPLDRIVYALEDAKVPVLLTVERLAAKLPELQTQVICLDADAAVIAQESEQNPVTNVTFDNFAYVIYTSGSTGRPKGTLIEHRGMMNYIQWAAQAYEVAAGDGVPVHSSIAFDLTVTAIIPPLMTGKQIVLVPQSVGVDSLLQVLEQYQNFSYIKLTPAHLKLLNQQVPPTHAKNLFRKIIIGGEALHADDVAFWLDNAPDTELINEYGPTETVVGSIVHTVSRDLEVSGSIRIGRPIANTQIYLLDNHQQLVPVGVPGEIYIGGAGVARGYLNLPELTAERFVPNPFDRNRSAKLYKTGDLARYLQNGELEYIGRIDDQVKVRGYRIELGEIESVLAHHSDVKDVVVTVVSVREEQADDKRLVAYLIPNEQDVLDQQELRRFAKQTLPDYMVPSHFMILDELPLTTNGKVDRRALPKPTDLSVARESAYVAPRDTLELQLVRIWEEILGVSDIGIQDDFFQLGGTSLLAVQVVMKIRKQLGTNLSLVSLYQDGTVEHLAGILREDGDEGQKSRLVELKKGNEQTPLFLVHPIGGLVNSYLDLAHEMGDRPIYGLQSPGLEDDQEVLTSVEAMATAYLEDIRTVQPEGPYLLAGWSFGGVVAFEMAQQLQTHGQEVAFLGMLDAHEPSVLEQVRVLSDQELLFDFVADMVQRFEWEVDRENWEPGSIDEGVREVYDVLHSQEKLPPHMEFADFHRFFEVYKVNRYANSTYRPKASDSSVTLFRATEGRDEFLLQHPTLGWEHLVRQLNVHDVEANHYSMMKAPHIQAIAAQIRACLPHEQGKTSVATGYKR
ncbi:MAG: non-ribosomal peptide synthetase, partial [Tumebacillaceae bacterium]